MRNECKLTPKWGSCARDEVKCVSKYHLPSLHVRYERRDHVCLVVSILQKKIQIMLGSIISSTAMSPYHCARILAVYPKPFQSQASPLASPYDSTYEPQPSCPRPPIHKSTGQFKKQEPSSPGRTPPAPSSLSHTGDEQRHLHRLTELGSSHHECTTL